jgi:hypothetical protein
MRDLLAHAVMELYRLYGGGNLGRKFLLPRRSSATARWVSS